MTPTAFFYPRPPCPNRDPCIQFYGVVLEQARIWLRDQPVSRGLGFRRQDSVQRDQTSKGELRVSFAKALYSTWHHPTDLYFSRQRGTSRGIFSFWTVRPWESRVNLLHTLVFMDASRRTIRRRKCSCLSMPWPCTYRSVPAPGAYIFTFLLLYCKTSIT